ncbi:MAG TPA: Ldh family oxidoreductase [Burkholderiales bacterium]|jgi:LDH2 family malate/lactate/ureidoglycolate dehydrogenase|nr:Ldh family oxidoreductase [Burkholderiales bacterium]
MSPERLRALVGDIFVRAGMVEANARTVADVLVWADLRGMGSHGVMRVPRYVGWMKRGDLNGQPKVSATESGATITLDADRAAGPVAMVRAAELAVAKARDTGIALVLVRSTTHTGAIGYYTQLGARAGMATIAITASVPNMAYHGARAAGVSTAPLSIAVPGEDEPLAVDMGSGVISIGKLAQARRAGTTLAADMALDAQGKPTTDPKEATIPLPLGGPKGSGLALLIECLSSLLAGNPILSEALEGTAKGKRHYQNALIIAIDVARFLPLAEFKTQVKRLIGNIKALPADGELLVPGERGHRHAQRTKDIKLPPSVSEELAALAKSFGLEVPA